MALKTIAIFYNILEKATDAGPNTFYYHLPFSTFILNNIFPRP